MTKKKEETKPAADGPEPSPPPPVEELRVTERTIAEVDALKHEALAQVIVDRFRDGGSTLIGPAKMVRSMKEMVEALSISAFMRPWVEDQIRVALLEGRQFTCRRFDTQSPKAVYRLCTEEDMLDLAKTGRLQDALTRSPAPDLTAKAKKEPAAKKETTTGAPTVPVKRSRAGSSFRLGPLKSDPKDAFDKLQKQGKIIYAIMRDHVGKEGGEIGPDELRLILEKRKEEIKTGQDVVKLFGFHMSQFYSKLGLVERVT